MWMKMPQHNNNLIVQAEANPQQQPNSQAEATPLQQHNSDAEGGPEVELTSEHVNKYVIGRSFEVPRDTKTRILMLCPIASVAK